MRKTLFTALGVAGLVAGLAVGSTPSPAADHLDAPIVQEDGRTDINDVYAFTSPDNPDNTVLIMTVNPAAGVLSPTVFDPKAKYEINVDNDGDGKREERIRVRFFEPDEDGNQEVTIYGSAGRADGTTGEEIELPDGGRAMVGTFDDPFFFDFQAFQDQVKAAGGPRTFCDDDAVDFFAGFNVSAIVIETPTDNLLGDSSMIGVWGDTRARGRADLMGRPGIATVLIDDGSEDQYNQTVPHKQLDAFGVEVRDNLLFLSGLDGSGYTEEEADGLVEILLPDILTFDTAEPAAYLNGRALEDDVIDTSLTVVTGGLGENGTPVLTSDCVDANDVDFPGTFPYLAPAHEMESAG